MSIHISSAVSLVGCGEAYARGFGCLSNQILGLPLMALYSKLYLSVRALKPYGTGLATEGPLPHPLTDALRARASRS
jgi:hypothetical protein